MSEWIRTNEDTLEWNGYRIERLGNESVAGALYRAFAPNGVMLAVGAGPSDDFKKTCEQHAADNAKGK